MICKWLWTISAAALALTACEKPAAGTSDSAAASAANGGDMQRRQSEYTSVTLSADTSQLTPKERQMIPLLIEAAKAMDPIFWQQTYGSRDSLVANVKDEGIRRFIDIN